MEKEDKCGTDDTLSKSAAHSVNNENSTRKRKSDGDDESKKPVKEPRRNPPRVARAVAVVVSPKSISQPSTSKTPSPSTMVKYVPTAEETKKRQAANRQQWREEQAWMAFRNAEHDMYFPKEAAYHRKRQEARDKEDDSDDDYGWLTGSALVDNDRNYEEFMREEYGESSDDEKK